MTYNVFSGTLNPAQSVSHVSISVLTFLVGQQTEHLACTIPASFGLLVRFGVAAGKKLVNQSLTSGCTLIMG